MTETHTTISNQIRKSLEWQLDCIRSEISEVGWTLRNLQHIDGDKEYAEYEVIEVLAEDTDWDGWEDYNKITTSKLFLKTVRYQAAFNVNV